MKMIAIVKMAYDSPALPWFDYRKGEKEEGVMGYVLAGDCVGLDGARWGAYILTGKAGAMVKVRQLEQVYELITIHGQGRIYQDTTLNGNVPAAIRNRINAWILEYTDFEEVPAGSSYRQMIAQVFKAMNYYFDLTKIEIKDVTV